MAIPVIMPKFGMAQEDATVIAWLYQDGDQVEKGAPILEVETDKTTMEVEAPGTGTLHTLGVKVGDVVPVTQVIAYVLEPGESLPEAGDPSLAHGEDERPHRVTPVARRMAAAEGIDLERLPISAAKRLISRMDIERVLAERSSIPPGGDPDTDRPRATPAARRLARELGLDLGSLAGRGPRGRIQAADVLATDAARTAQVGVSSIASALQPSQVVPLSGLRRTIAARMTQSYQRAPHITLTIDADMAAALDLLRMTDLQSEQAPTRISITALLVKVCAWALTRHPQVNASFHEDGIHSYPHANIGVAVALDDGLIVPVIHQAETHSIAAIAARLRSLAAAAREGVLKPDDVYGGTFTISNLGMYGIRQFSAIINPPQSAILAVGAIIRQPVAVETDHGEAVVVRPRMALTLSVDHRTLDGVSGALFLQDVVAALEDPALLPAGTGFPGAAK